MLELQFREVTCDLSDITQLESGKAGVEPPGILTPGLALFPQSSVLSGRLFSHQVGCLNKEVQGGKERDELTDA